MSELLRACFLGEGSVGWRRVCVGGEEGGEAEPGEMRVLVESSFSLSGEFRVSSVWGRVHRIWWRDCGV